MRIVKSETGYLVGKDIQQLKDQNVIQDMINKNLAKAINMQRFAGLCYGVAGMLMINLIANIEKRLEAIEGRFKNQEE